MVDKVDDWLSDEEYGHEDDGEVEEPLDWRLVKG